tara:strand:+ start:123 stop:356 length:234 start_codon:yes stop_codon:yes gene_type:complete
MKLTPIAANQTSVTFNDGTEVFFSYKTPVAAYLPEKGYVKTEKFYSVTTSRHINKYLPTKDVPTVSEEFLVKLSGDN